MTNNTYWQTFPTNMVDAPGLLIPQQTPPSHLSHSHHHPQQPQQPQQHPNPQQQQQQPWSDEADKRKWSQEFGEFDINSHANKMFRMYMYSSQLNCKRLTSLFIDMDDYNNSNNNSNNDPSEGDSPGIYFSWKVMSPISNTKSLHRQWQWISQKTWFIIRFWPVSGKLTCPTCCLCHNNDLH